MIILGLHFGHDASVTLLKDGKIIFCIEKERVSRIRHVIGLNFSDIKLCLKKFNVNINEIDYCSVTSTQDVEYIFEDQNLNFDLDFDALNKFPDHWFHKKKKLIIDQIKKKNLLNLISKKTNHPYTKKISKKFLRLKKINFFGSIENFYQSKSWLKGAALKQIGRLFEKKKCDTMQLPIKFKLGKRIIPGFILSHHFAHAAYCFYSSNFRESAIITQDGAMPKTPYLSGMCYYGKNNELYPVLPHFLNLGRIYDSVSELIGFDRTSGPGKTMGLAPYGKPKFFNKKFVGNIYDYKKINIKNFKSSRVKWSPHKLDTSTNKWISYCLTKAKKLNYNFSQLGNTSKILSKINTDIASSTQLLLEETILSLVKLFKKILKSKNLATNNLCLSGGTFLNCPANSRVFNKKIFKNLYVPPAIHDGGLSIGSSQAIYYNTLKKNRVKNDMNSTEYAYLGAIHKQNINLIKKKYSKRLKFINKKITSKEIATNISKNKIVAVYRDRSEVGPRALGNRSILADPRNYKNWRKVNKIKSRELWRPFAPAVIKNDLLKYFSNSPKVTPYMLFTANVRSKKLPAITHVDNSSRVQTLSNKKNQLYKILKEFKKITGYSVLMNTSFNGPGEPIVETYEDAVNFFMKSKLDILYLDNFEVRKNI